MDWTRFEISEYHRQSNGQYNSPSFSGFETFSMGLSDRSSHQSRSNQSRSLLSTTSQDGTMQQQIFTFQNQNNALRERIIELEVEVRIHQSFLSSDAIMIRYWAASLLFHKHRLPVHTLPTSGAPLPAIVILKEEEYKEAKFWQSTKWNLYVKKQKGRTPPSSERLKTIRRLTSSFFFEFQQENNLPETWTKASLTVKHRFRAIIESAVPELRLCADQWKTEKLASVTYSSWCGTHAKGKKIKVESDAEQDLDMDEDDEDEDDDSGDDEKSDVAQNSGGQAPKRKPTSTLQQNPPLKKIKTSESNSKGKKKDTAKRLANPLLGKTPRMRLRLLPTAIPSSSVSDAASTSTSTGEAQASQSSPDSPSLAVTPASCPSATPQLLRLTRLQLHPPLCLAATLLNHIPYCLPEPLNIPHITSPPVQVFPPPPPLDHLPPPQQTSSILPAPPVHAAPAPIRVPVPVHTVLPPAPHPAIPTPRPVIPASNPVLPPPRPVLPTPSRTPQEAQIMGPPANANAGQHSAIKKPRAWNPPATSTTATFYVSRVGMCKYKFKQDNQQATLETFTAYYSNLSKEEKAYWKKKELEAQVNKVDGGSLFLAASTYTYSE
ncbi:hypothetical protein R3P38DRAFT_3206499 [Favolaschia claudopus]|uniref:Uncharacterized protein n=1 Tax=Favolaschia claudopus TaxID=2862362 RepID=A0AAW0ALZ3_9AGAR